MKKKILVVDDDEATRITLDDLLSDHGYDVTSASTSLDGYRAARSWPFDLLILDLMLDQETTAAEVIDGLIRDGSGVPPILLVTGHPRKIVERWLPGRVPPSVEKPFTTGELLAAVARLTGTRR